MELEKIKELVEMMKSNDLSELEIVDGQTRIMIRRGAGQGPAQVITMPPVVSSAGAGQVAAAAVGSAETAQAKGPSQEKVEEEEKLLPIVCPMVGTFYSAPSPSAEAFVEVGSVVEEDSVVCIIEAMKVMNEIKSEVRGTIKKVLVSNGAAVEYGQALFLVEPA